MALAPSSVLESAACPGAEQGLPMCREPPQESQRRVYCGRCDEWVDLSVEHWRCYGCDCRACDGCVVAGETCAAPPGGGPGGERAGQPPDPGGPPRRGEAAPPTHAAAAPAPGCSGPTATEEGSHSAKAPASSVSSKSKRKREDGASPQRGEDPGMAEGEPSTVAAWEGRFCPELHRPVAEQVAALKALQQWWKGLRAASRGGRVDRAEAKAYNALCSRLRARGKRPTGGSGGGSQGSEASER
eukprot:TRINITY_DN1936_c0_g1_i4.p1 TRINITY_DN1936_c0_g1~~TRINITY_DN1936_c0_g1_i4.p1  ORF type:complete len:243 (+),score=21.48 TRINITY_DN1936_c0_g1_i4:1036-1764(+)